MPNSNTFECKPIGQFVERYSIGMVVDPFARNTRYPNGASITNDLNPDTTAQYHLDAEDFLKKLQDKDVQINCAIFDPPYSPRQISECYQSIGKEVNGKDTQNAALYKRVRDALDPLVVVGGIVLSFGWNSGGMGKARGYEIEEILMVTHGGAHNDTICMAERKTSEQMCRQANLLEPVCQGLTHV